MEACDRTVRSHLCSSCVGDFSPSRSVELSNGVPSPDFLALCSSFILHGDSIAPVLPTGRALNCKRWKKKKTLDKKIWNTKASQAGSVANV